MYLYLVEHLYSHSLCFTCLAVLMSVVVDNITSHESRAVTGWSNAPVSHKGMGNVTGDAITENVGT